jgi:rare lipoprotein A
MQASWYSVQSLKNEGTYKYSKGVMANGTLFVDDNLTCATRLYPLGTILRITNLDTKRSVEVKVTDRIGKRFTYKRIDLSKGAFSKIADCKSGIISCIVMEIK